MFDDSTSGTYNNYSCLIYGTAYVIYDCTSRWHCVCVSSVFLIKMFSKSLSRGLDISSFIGLISLNYDFIGCGLNLSSVL